MVTQFSKDGKFKFEMGSLYELDCGRWLHVMKCPPKVKSLEAAIAAYQD